MRDVTFSPFGSVLMGCHVLYNEKTRLFPSLHVKTIGADFCYALEEGFMPRGTASHFRPSFVPSSASPGWNIRREELLVISNYLGMPICRLKRRSQLVAADLGGRVSMQLHLWPSKCHLTP